MVSVAEAAEAVRDRIAAWGERLAVAAVNGPAATVVCGESAALEELAAACESDGIRARPVPVDYASHGRRWRRSGRRSWPRWTRSPRARPRFR